MPCRMDGRHCPNLVAVSTFFDLEMGATNEMLREGKIACAFCCYPVYLFANRGSTCHFTTARE